MTDNTEFYRFESLIKHKSYFLLVPVPNNLLMFICSNDNLGKAHNILAEDFLWQPTVFMLLSLIPI